MAHRPQDTPAKQFRVGEKQRGVPAEKHQTVNAFCLGMTGNVVKAAQGLHIPHHGAVRLPGAPDEHQQRETDGDKNTRNDAQQNHPEETRHR